MVRLTSVDTGLALPRAIQRRRNCETRLSRPVTALEDMSTFIGDLLQPFDISQVLGAAPKMLQHNQALAGDNP
jgi:hypothetical protein